MSDDGVMIVSFDEALRRAKEENLDLVEVSGDQEIHVCKIIDYGKYKFELLKKSKEAKKKQHVINVKEVKIRPRIEQHDYEIKKRHAVEFLQKGDKVKVSLRFRGREMMHSELGMNVVNRMVEDLKSVGTPEREPVLDGRQIVVVITPLAAKQ
ncbi:translation initiation factor IF-3 [Leptospira licerasiae str. MMD4847]|uniref:Translation initiation factor IF-3 n=1 Tax=Leptospira licerasiae str. MMD4847 TaxID=1049971 RepID=A0ABN0H751_9LEPT|nr:translation initiation factor IF-3 [Leptospira licerasiae str. MMD4847]